MEPGTIATIAGAVVGLASFLAGREESADVNRLLRQILAEVRRAKAEILAAIRESDFNALAGQVDGLLETLIAYDPVQQDEPRLRTICHRLRYATVYDAGHMLHHERPDEVAALIEEFLESK